MKEKDRINTKEVDLFSQFIRNLISANNDEIIDKHELKELVKVKCDKKLRRMQDSGSLPPRHPNDLYVKSQIIEYIRSKGD